MTNVRTVCQQLARQGQQAMNSVKSDVDQARIGEAYLGSVENRSSPYPKRFEAVLGSSPYPESAVANTARRAWRQMEGCLGQLAVANAALAAIAAGVNGPVAATLASVGLNSMLSNPTSSVVDQARTGLIFTASVRDNASGADERDRAEAALRAASGVTTANSQVSILKTFLASSSQVSILKTFLASL